MKPAFAIYRPQYGEYSGGFEQLLRQEKADEQPAPSKKAKKETT